MSDPKQPTQTPASAATPARKSEPGAAQTPAGSQGPAPGSSSRREFLRTTGHVGAAALLGGMAGIAAAPRPLRAQDQAPEPYPGKEQLIVRSPRPVNLEPPVPLLEDAITPTNLHFVRNNGLIPDVDPATYTLTVDGEVDRPLKLSLSDLEGQFEVFTQAANIECGGNGRANFDPKVRGNQWDRGAVACSEWTGVRLRDVLNAAGVKSSAVYLGNFGLDESLNPGTVERFSRGIPIDKAMDPHTMIAFRMNGKPIPPEHGYPVRLVVPGWIGSASQKWLSRIWVRDRVHDSAKMTGKSYRVPAYPVAPGADVPTEDFVIATAWHIKSLITRPAPDATARVGQPFEIHGAAWAGEDQVQRVELSFDHGRHWTTVQHMSEQRNKYAWHRWTHTWTPEEFGYHEIWARAWDQNGNTQPPIQPWNPKGYLGNVIHRVPVTVARA